ncbi:MAG: VOC family protein [Pseudomonadota bacterium]
MTLNHFVWTDLSTFDVRAAEKDFAEMFGWSYRGGRQYRYALIGSSPVAAIFPMPKRLVDLNMPSFWMSYVHVADLRASVEKARGHDGVVIEIEPTPFDKNATIALIRDPSGAGFTLYEGPEIWSSDTVHGTGRVAGRFHHVPDIGLIEPFYSDMFGWRFQKEVDEPWPVYGILDDRGRLVAKAEEVPEEIRGKFRYWIPCFAVQSLEETRKRLTRRAGELVTDLGDGRLMLADQQGAHFMVRAV